MNTEQIAGAAKQAVGRIVSYFGKMVADLEAVAGGRAKKTEGKVQDSRSDAKNTSPRAPEDTQ
jgi:uncharacterized protein YjbJ (UPF0337 family)